MLHHVVRGVGIKILKKPWNRPIPWLFPCANGKIPYNRIDSEIQLQLGRKQNDGGVRIMKRKQKSWHLISPYVLLLTLFGLGGLLLCACLTVSFLYEQCQYNLMSLLSEYWLVLVMLLSILVVYLLICFHKAYEYWGYITIDDSKLICHAPFRKPLAYWYSEIQEIGIDYGWLSVNKQFWIYLGTERFPIQYCHRIHHLPISSSFVRIQFSEPVFNALLEQLPRELQKKLRRSKTADVSS